MPIYTFTINPKAIPEELETDPAFVDTGIPATFKELVQGKGDNAEQFNKDIDRTDIEIDGKIYLNDRRDLKEEARQAFLSMEGVSNRDVEKAISGLHQGVAATALTAQSRFLKTNPLSLNINVDQTGVSAIYKRLGNDFIYSATAPILPMLETGDTLVVDSTSGLTKQMPFDAAIIELGEGGSCRPIGYTTIETRLSLSVHDKNGVPTISSEVSQFTLKVESNSPKLTLNATATSPNLTVTTVMTIGEQIRSLFERTSTFFNNIVPELNKLLSPLVQMTRNLFTTPSVPKSNQPKDLKDLPPEESIPPSATKEEGKEEGRQLDLDTEELGTGKSPVTFSSSPKVPSTEKSHQPTKKPHP